jgi:hypothetical protein
VTTHENSTTMSHYWYGLAVRGSCDCRTVGMFGEAAMAKPWDGVGIARMAGTHKAQEGASRWVRCSHWR